MDHCFLFLYHSFVLETLLNLTRDLYYIFFFFIRFSNRYFEKRGETYLRIRSNSVRFTAAHPCISAYVFQRMPNFPKAQLPPFLSSQRAGRSPRSSTKLRATTLISLPRSCRFVFSECLVCSLSPPSIHTHRKVAVHSTWLWLYQTEPVTLTSRGGGMN